MTLSYVSAYGLNSSPYTAERLTTVNGIEVVGSYAYVVGQGPSGRAQMLKLDISNLSSISHDNDWYVGSSGSIRDINYESPYLYMAVDGTSGDLYRFNPSTGFTITDLGFDTALSKTAGSSYVGTSGGSLNYYYSHADWSYFDNIHALKYDSNYSRVYAAGYYDLGWGELYTLQHQSNETFLEVVSPFTMDSQGWNYFFSDMEINDIYLYGAIGDGGILTLNIDDDPYLVENRNGHSATSGDPRNISLGGISSNYLVAISDKYSISYNDRLTVYDIHYENNSNRSPYLIASRDLVYGNPRALYVSGNTIFSVEGTYLVIYQMNPNTN